MHSLDRAAFKRQPLRAVHDEDGRPMFFGWRSRRTIT